MKAQKMKIMICLNNKRKLHKNKMNRFLLFIQAEEQVYNFFLSKLMRIQKKRKKMKMHLRIFKKNLQMKYKYYFSKMKRIQDFYK